MYVGAQVDITCEPRAPAGQLAPVTAQAAASRAAERAGRQWAARG